MDDHRPESLPDRVAPDNTPFVEANRLLAEWCRRVAAAVVAIVAAFQALFQVKPARKPSPLLAAHRRRRHRG